MILTTTACCGPAQRTTSKNRKSPPATALTAVARRPTVLLCDDQKLVRALVREVLQNLSSMQVIGEAVDGLSAVSMALQLRPDVVLMDISMPGLNGIEATRKILAESPEIRVLGFSADADIEFMRQMSKAGARGYVVKTGDPVELIVALHRVLAGEYCFNFSAAKPATGPRLD